MFGTVMNYVSMRLLGVDINDERMVRGRKWICDRGGAVGIPAWGKFWLAALGVYSWAGLNPIPPELWILPYWLPIHPGRWWCHCRVVYLPMAWIYGSRKSLGISDPIVASLREELYVHVYETIDWPSHKFNICSSDVYKPGNLLHQLVFGLCSVYEYFRPQWLRTYALSVALDHVRYEDRETNYICIGPVNKAIDMLVEYWASDGSSDAFKQHVLRVPDYLWLASDGMKMQGYNGSQLWDTAFSLQAVLSTGLSDSMPDVTETMRRGYHYIDISQVRENNRQREKYYRHISKGAWPFSTRDHGWPISDCTAEGFVCALELPQQIAKCKGMAIEEERLFDAVNVMLSYQNEDGGWPSYENQRGPAWLELLNPSGVFDGIMVDYSYVECSSSCIKALLHFKTYHPQHRKQEIEEAVRRGVRFLQRAQRPDGSWQGCWGVCFTYGIWFATQALHEAKIFGLGENLDSTLEKAWSFLLEKQHEDGSWGEDFRSCCERRWVDLPEGHVVNTSWALCSLMLKNSPEEAIHRGIEWLIKKQLPNGDWEQEGVSGVFNYNCAISYSGYKNIFPIWALGMYLQKRTSRK
eukprot:TRINITY_DN11414_c0_g1_i17.p1 TRINITY_DN11414_c0_g1~~TRINITY_DN11414_c0_g1_i17.p1  ORF type:complete len:580 (+),score=109.10 TRINITY_DN11414_c0_g1_i17:1123-2862(+)